LNNERHYNQGYICFKILTLKGGNRKKAKQKSKTLGNRTNSKHER